MFTKYIFKANDNGKNISGDIFIKSSIFNKKLLDSLSSFPEKKGDYIAYISPYNFETLNNIYIYNLKEKVKEKIYSHNELRCPKYLKWKDEKTIYVIMGQTYGTLAIGGDLYSLNIYNKKVELLKEFPIHIQITSFEFKDDNKILLKGIEYIDNNFNENKEYSNLISI